MYHFVIALIDLNFVRISEYDYEGHLNITKYLTFTRKVFNRLSHKSFWHNLYEIYYIIMETFCIFLSNTN